MLVGIGGKHLKLILYITILQTEYDTCKQVKTFRGYEIDEFSRFEVVHVSISISKL
jgi:hypothetical protein